MQRLLPNNLSISKLNNNPSFLVFCTFHFELPILHFLITTKNNANFLDTLIIAIP